jgi:hypothetical protein
VVDLPGGAKRVTLTANYVESLGGQGWHIATARITPGSAGADFSLAATMVISLGPAEGGTLFCRMQPAAGAPAFARVEDVPDDAATCATTWNRAQLGGNSGHADSQWAGQAYLLSDPAGVVVAKLLMVADSIIDGDVSVTFDILAL